jgi:hypothetical protein
MDPWGGKEVDTSGINSSCQNLFDDNFFPESPGCLVPSQRPTNYQPLPDSEEYLSNLGTCKITNSPENIGRN